MTFYRYETSPLPDSFFLLKSVLSDINIVTPTFCLMFSCCIFKKNIFIYLREKERQSMHTRVQERGKGQREKMSKPTSTEQGA